MQYDEFIQRVQIEGEIESRDEALEATEAVLSTLGECIYQTEVADLAAQLPRGIGDFLTARQPPERSKGDVQHYSLEEFYNRVSARTNSRYPQAVKLARAVTEVLMDAVSGGQIEDIKRELPEGFGDLFKRGM